MPQAIAGALVSAFGSAAFGWGAAYTIAYTVVIAGTVEYNKAQKRKAQARARAAANASAKDREVMIRSAIAPRRIVYGRDRISGPIVYMESTGDKSQYLHLVVALAAHECDAIETIFFNEVALPTEDGSGYITSGEFARAGEITDGTHSGTSSAGGEITLPHDAVEITAVYSETGVGENYQQTQITGYSHTPNTPTITGLPASAPTVVHYTYNGSWAYPVRIKRHLGSPTQTADADLVAESAGNWTSDHRGRGICYLYVRLEYDQEIFGGIGVPNISAVVRGKKVRDPRTGTTAWTDNAALCIADWLQSDEGMRASGAEVPDSEISAAANICDETVTLNLAGTETQKRYTVNSSWTSEQSPRDVLADMCQAMGGRAVWTQGRWLVRPGAYRTPTVTITADMLAGPISIAPRASRSELFNCVRVTHRDAAQNYADVQAPLVSNSGYETDDGGVRIVRQIDLPTLADTYRAQRLGKLELERARQALTVKLACNLQAYDLAPTDTVLLTLATYGWSGKAFEVLDRTLSTEGTIQYTLRETAAGVYDWNYGEATVGDLAPNTDLPDIFGKPGALTNFSASEITSMLADGTIVTHALISWDASTSAAVLSAGRIELQTARAGEPYGGVLLPGDATSTVQGPLVEGVAYIARVRAVSPTGVVSSWAHTSLVALGAAAPPQDVANLDATIKPTQVWATWDPCTDGDYAYTELREGGTGWADATFLARVAGSDYKHPRPPDGTYIVRAKHVDTTGNASANAASKSITITSAAIDTAGDSVYVEYSTDGTGTGGGAWHSTFAAGDEFARWKIGAGGTWTDAFRIVGETGAGGPYKDFVFRRAASKPATPTGKNPSGWYDAPPAADGNPLWASLADKYADGELLGAWSEPVQIEGPPGPPGGTGPSGARGSLDFYISGSSPLTDAECNSAVLSQTGSSTRVLGDTVTEYDGSTYVSVKRWNGSAWVAPGTVIDGSVLVAGTVTAAKLAANSVTADKIVANSITATKLSIATLSSITADIGTVTAGNLSTSGYIANAGYSTQSILDPAGGGWGSGTVAVYCNSSSSAEYGVVGLSSTDTGAGVYGYNSAAFPGKGVAGIGAIGVYGRTTSPSGYGAYIQGYANGYPGLSVAAGYLSVADQIKSYVVTGTAPFTIYSTTVNANLNADMVDGYHASSFQLALGYTPVQQGTGPSQTGNAVKIGWSAGAMLRVAVDSTDFGATWPINVSGTAAKLSATVTASNAGGALTNTNAPSGHSGGALRWISLNISGTNYIVPCLLA